MVPPGVPGHNAPDGIGAMLVDAVAGQIPLVVAKLDDIALVTVEDKTVGEFCRVEDGPIRLLMAEE
jgi:hypothetical protein